MIPQSIKNRFKVIVDLSAFITGSTPEMIIGPSMTKDTQQARAIAMWIAHRNLPVTMLTLGKLFDRDRKTIRTSVARMDALFNSDPKFAELLGRIQEAVSQ